MTETEKLEQEAYEHNVPVDYIKFRSELTSPAVFRVFLAAKYTTDVFQNSTPSEEKTEKAPPFTTERPFPCLNTSPFFEIPIASKAHPQNP